jgi:hypothetical protein
VTPRVRLFADRDYADFVGASGGLSRGPHEHANIAVVALNTALGYAIVDSWGGYELAIR